LVENYPYLCGEKLIEITMSTITHISLKNPPVIRAACQLDFDDGIQVRTYDSCREKLLDLLPLGRGGKIIAVDHPNPTTEGKVVVEVEARLEGYFYSSTDEKTSLELQSNKILFSDSHPYQGWDKFFNDINLYIDILDPVISGHTVDLVAVKFVNQFLFSEPFDPADYFTSLPMSQGGVDLPIVGYTFGFLYQLPLEDGHIKSAVSQKLESGDEGFVHLFGVDAFDSAEFAFNKDTLIGKLNHLRGVKNMMFFKNITDKTIKLCN
jgi:uncharacterized protein (TIGR04255 family)